MFYKSSLQKLNELKDQNRASSTVRPNPFANGLSLFFKQLSYWKNFISQKNCIRRMPALNLDDQHFVMLEKVDLLLLMVC